MNTEVGMPAECGRCFDELQELGEMVEREVAKSRFRSRDIVVALTIREVDNSYLYQQLFIEKEVEVA